MTTLTENIHTGAYIVSEMPGFFSRDQITMANAVESVSGTVIAKTGVPAAENVASAPNVNNVGNGTLTVDGTAPIAAAAVDGVYQVEFLTATTFEILDPTGIGVGRGTVGQTFSGPLKFAIAAGGTAFAAGDGFALTVLRPDGAADTWAPLAAGGSAAGVLFTHVKVPTVPGVQQATAHVRACELRTADLTWPAGFTAPQIQEGVEQLRRLGIILRS